MKGLKELLEMKARTKMDPMDKKAKLGVLGDIGKMATGMMGNDLKGLKKVTVAAPDKSSLEMGLDKAKDMMGNHDEEGSDAEEASETPEMEASEEASEGEDEGSLDSELEKVKADPSLENIDMLMKLLEDKKNALIGSHGSEEDDEAGMKL